jgi:predicted DNA binding CopG/RHH family protein
MTIIKPENIKLDDYEQEIEDNFDHLKAYFNDKKKEKMQIYQQAAKNYLKKDKRITIRVYSSDLERLKMLAAGEGLPYQTYITSMLHKI